jgi:hypothetical protein
LEDGTSPRVSISSEKDMKPEAFLSNFDEDTLVFLPWCLDNKPSLTRLLIAERTVMRLTERASAYSLSDGISSPGLSSPSSIKVFRLLYICKYFGDWLSKVMNIRKSLAFLVYTRAIYHYFSWLSSYEEIGHSMF